MDPTMGYLKLNLASQSRRLSSSIAPKPCRVDVRFSVGQR